MRLAGRGAGASYTARRAAARGFRKPQRPSSGSRCLPKAQKDGPSALNRAAHTLTGEAPRSAAAPIHASESGGTLSSRGEARRRFNHGDHEDVTVELPVATRAREGEPPAKRKRRRRA